MGMTWKTNLDVGVVYLQAELIQLGLDVFNDMILEYLTLLEDFLHGHSGDDDTGLTLNNTLDDILHVTASRTRGDPRRWLGTGALASENFCVLH